MIRVLDGTEKLSPETALACREIKAAGDALWQTILRVAPPCGARDNALEAVTRAATYAAIAIAEKRATEAV